MKPLRVFPQRKQQQLDGLQGSRNGVVGLPLKETAPANRTGKVRGSPDVPNQCGSIAGVILLIVCGVIKVSHWGCIPFVYDLGDFGTIMPSFGLLMQAVVRFGGSCVFHLLEDIDFPSWF